VNRLSGAAWSFVGASLAESAAIYRALGVYAVDLIAAPGALLDSDQLIARPTEVAEAVNRVEMPVANLIFTFGSNFFDRALNHIESDVRSRNANEFESVLQFCRAARVPSITLLPGVEQPGWSRDTSLAIAAEVLNEFTARAARDDIRVFFEAHVQSLLEHPAQVYAFLRSNPNLKLTLDYSHFICAGYTQDQVDPLAAFAGHVHLRQARAGVLQARWSDGAIDFRRVVQVLEACGYTGYYALEYEHDPWMGNDQVDVISETIKMREVVNPLLGCQLPSGLGS
jgi:sugar phosphate isomerase/epimerase